MGLLLGASLVTVCELLDVLVVTCVTKTLSWVRHSGDTQAKTKYYSDTYSHDVLQHNDNFSFGTSNGTHLIKSQSMHSLNNVVDSKDKVNFGIGSLVVNFKSNVKASSPNYAFERSVFSFDAGDIFSHQ